MASARMLSATILAHEAGHAIRYDTVSKSNNLQDIIQYKTGLKDKSDKQYDTIEEKIVITTTERHAAIKHGEILPNQPARKSHDVGTFFSTQGMSVQEISSKLILNNKLFIYE